jgi:hypothetical protein
MIWHSDVLTLEDAINAAMASMRYVADTGFDGTIYYVLTDNKQSIVSTSDSIAQGF